MSQPWSAVAAAAAVAVLAGGCIAERELTPIAPRVSRIFETQVGGDGIGDVDVLFVIDDSNSMEQEQASLRREIPRLIEGLTNPPLDENGQPQWAAVESLRVGIVSTNMGSLGYPETRRLPPICQQNGHFGDNGELRQSCAESSGVLSWQDGDSPSEFADRVACVADAGIDGCGLEMPLLAATEGLMAGGEAFPREDSLLAIVVLSDEEDCSLSDPAAFFATADVGVQLNQRCSREPGLLVPVDAIVEGLIGERDRANILFAALVGVPDHMEDLSFDELLALPEMQYQYLPTDTGLAVACERSTGDGVVQGSAAPGRRYLEIAKRLEGSLVRSICAESYQPAITELTARIGARVGFICANRSLTPDADGAVVCDVIETLPEGEVCADYPARVFVEINEQGRQVCEVLQAVRGQTEGWRYDVSNPTCEQVAYFPLENAPPRGTKIDLACLVDVEAPVDGSPIGE
ncbi:MAG: hypothetical protein AB8H86_31685 [Polyangiales bacterium]